MKEKVKITRLESGESWVTSAVFGKIAKLMPKQYKVTKVKGE